MVSYSTSSFATVVNENVVKRFLSVDGNIVNHGGEIEEVYVVHVERWSVELGVFHHYPSVVLRVVSVRAEGTSMAKILDGS